MAKYLLVNLLFLCTGLFAELTYFDQLSALEYSEVRNAIGEIIFRLEDNRRLGWATSKTDTQMTHEYFSGGEHHHLYSFPINTIPLEVNYERMRGDVHSYLIDRMSVYSFRNQSFVTADHGDMGVQTIYLYDKDRDQVYQLDYDTLEINDEYNKQNLLNEWEEIRSIYRLRTKDLNEGAAHYWSSNFVFHLLTSILEPIDHNYFSLPWVPLDAMSSSRAEYIKQKISMANENHQTRALYPQFSNTQIQEAIRALDYINLSQDAAQLRANINILLPPRINKDYREALRNKLFSWSNEVYYEDKELAKKCLQLYIDLSLEPFMTLGDNYYDYDLEHYYNVFDITQIGGDSELLDVLQSISSDQLKYAIYNLACLHSMSGELSKSQFWILVAREINVPRFHSLLKEDADLANLRTKTEFIQDLSGGNIQTLYKKYFWSRFIRENG
jgi:hypothetical protein